MSIYHDIHLLRFERPAFRRAAKVPCRFIPWGVGRGAMPFDFLHSSLLELRGPCVDVRFDCDSVSTCMESGEDVCVGCGSWGLR